MNHDHSQGMSKHLLIMLLCCLVPLALIIGVSTFGLSLGPQQALLPYALVLLCPLMMIFMMRGMMQGQGDDHSQHHQVDAPRPQTPNQLNQLPTSTRGAIETIAGSGHDKCH